MPAAAGSSVRAKASQSTRMLSMSLAMKSASFIGYGTVAPRGRERRTVLAHAARHDAK
jgi:hypothetical protein